MTEAELLKLTRKNNQLLTADDLVNKEPRTLLLGSTPQGHAWHVYLDLHQRIQRVVYSPTLLLRETSKFAENQDFIPLQSLYPENCDAEFCGLLVKAGERLPFGPFLPKGNTNGAATRVYAGQTLHELAPRRSHYLDRTDLNSSCNSEVLANLMLTQAALEEKVTYENGFVGVYVRAHAVSSVLARANAFSKELQGRFRAPDAALSPMDYAEGALEVLDVHSGVMVNSAAWLGGTLAAEVLAVLPHRLTQKALEASGFVVAPYGSGFCLRASASKGLAWSQYLAVLCPVRKDGQDSPDDFHYLERYFGSEDTFFEKAAGYAGLFSLSALA